MKYNQLLTWKKTKPFLGSYIDWSHHLAQGLIGCWIFNEGRGNLIQDLSLNKNTGTCAGGPIWKPGRTGVALYFDGSDDYVDINNKDSFKLTDNFSVSAWVRGATNGAVQGIAGRHTSSVVVKFNGYVISKWSDDKYTFMVSSNDSYELIQSNVAYTDTKWHHIMGIMRGGTSYLYVDGVEQVDTGSQSIANHADYGPKIGLLYGDRTNQYIFEGVIDSVYIHNRALSVQEVAYIYKEPFCFIKNPIMDYVIVAPAVAGLSETRGVGIGIDRGIGIGIG